MTTDDDELEPEGEAQPPSDDSKPKKKPAAKVNRGGRPRGSKKKPEPLDDIRVINRHDLASLLGCSISTLRRMEKDDPTWPKPFVLSPTRPTLFYLRADVEAYIALRRAEAEQHRKPPPNLGAKGTH